MFRVKVHHGHDYEMTMDMFNKVVTQKMSRRCCIDFITLYACGYIADILMNYL